VKTVYKDYVQLYNSKACILLRAILKKIEDDCHSQGVADSHVHNNVIKYFNKQALHKKYTKDEFHKRLKQINCGHKTAIHIETYHNKSKLYECTKCEHRFIKSKAA